MAELRVEGRIERAGFVLQVPAMVFEGAGVTALFGPSGSGKSTFLDALAGLVPAPALAVRHGGADWRGCAPQRRGIGMVRQQEPLFAHMSVAQNLRFPLRFVDQTLFSFDQVVETLGLSDLLARHPHQLSGGQRQRVALGRALLRQPRWLFLDEPISALDDRARQQVLQLLDRVRRAFAVPMLLVTHRVDEVETLADAVAFVSDGRVRPPVPIAEAVSRPGSPLFAEAEPVSLLMGRVITPQDRDGLGVVEAGGCRFLTHPVRLASGANCRIRVPASQVMLARAVDGTLSALNRLSLRIEALDPQGHQVVVTLALQDGQRLLATVTRRSAEALHLAPGETVQALIKAVSIL